MRLVPVLSAVVVPLRQLAVSNLALIAGDRGKHGVQVFKINVHHATLALTDLPHESQSTQKPNAHED
jgi:hypothetical protein